LADEKMDTSIGPPDRKIFKWSRPGDLPAFSIKCIYAGSVQLRNRKIGRVMEKEAIIIQAC
jgi:hypothetical protein